MKKLIFATTNSHKTSEVQAMLGSEFEVLDLRAFPEIEPAEETGTTFEENAILKAVSVSNQVSLPVLADDSGLEVDALDGAPGVYSARYSGEGATDASNRAKLLAELDRVGARGKARSGRFRCAMALANAGEMVATTSGAVEGILTPAERGEGGFGYDPLFVPDGYCETFAELPSDVKNQLSHRAAALEKMRAML